MVLKIFGRRELEPKYEPPKPLSPDKILKLSQTFLTPEFIEMLETHLSKNVHKLNRKKKTQGRIFFEDLEKIAEKAGLSVDDMSNNHWFIVNFFLSQSWDVSVVFENSFFIKEKTIPGKVFARFGM